MHHPGDFEDGSSTGPHGNIVAGTAVINVGAKVAAAENAAKQAVGVAKKIKAKAAAVAHETAATAAAAEKV